MIIGIGILLSIAVFLIICYIYKIILLEKDQANVKRIMIVVFLLTVCFVQVCLMNCEAEVKLKSLLTYTILVPIAFIDYREHIIPNKLLLFWICLRCLFFVVEYFLSKAEMRQEMINCIAAMVIVTGALFVLSLITGNGIGMGDVKLFATLGFTWGIKTIYNIAFYSALSAALVSIILLVLKRVSRTSKFAYAPYILIGTFITLM